MIDSKKIETCINRDGHKNSKSTFKFGVGTEWVHRVKEVKFEILYANHYIKPEHMVIVFKIR